MNDTETLDSLGRTVRRVPLVARFWAKVDRSNSSGCWIWRASTQRRGYGQIEVNGRPRIAPRVAWELTFGPIPSGMFICHRCDNPSCVRPDHLFLGTPGDNVRDMDKKGRRISVVRRGETHHAARLARHQARAIRDRARAGEDQHMLAAEFGISNVTVSAIKTGRLWKCLD